MPAPWVAVDVSESSDVYSSSESSESSESSNESPQVKKRRQGSHEPCSEKLTMRMPLPRKMPVIRGSAAVGASSSKEAYTVVRGSAAVGASSSKRAYSPPFEAESQEGELNSFRAAIREHAQTGGSPPPVPAINAASGKACRSRAPTPDRASRGPEKKELDKAEDDKSAVGEKSGVGGSSAFGDESAARGEATREKVVLKSSEDVQKDLDPQWVKKCISESLEYDDIFSKTSPLSKATNREIMRPGCEVGTHCCPGAAVFLKFDWFSGAEIRFNCQRHFHEWTRAMKESIFDDTRKWEKLLEDVPARLYEAGNGRPWASNHPHVDSPSQQLQGLFSKYNYQYRRPCASDSILMDSWCSGFTIKGSPVITPDLLDLFNGDDYNVEEESLRNTFVWGQGSVAWQTWKGSSMLVPITPEDPAVGGNEYLCRCVITTCFPAFCYVLGENFTARQVEVAWNKLPIVKISKKNRGTNGGWWKKPK
jgi:hypothetical protein